MVPGTAPGGSWPAWPQRDARIRLIDLPANRGRGHARRTGIAAARGGLVATVDADIILPADWLDRTRAALTGHDAVGGTAVPDGDVGYVYRRFRLAPRVVASTTTVTGNNGLYRRGVFDRVSFDEALREGEDSALNHAMASQGLSAAIVPGLLVQHREGKSFGSSLRWLFDTGQGATRQLLRYRRGAPAGPGGRRLRRVAGGRSAGRASPAPAAGRGHPGWLRAGRRAASTCGPGFTPRPAEWRRVAPAVAVDGGDAHRVLCRAAGWAGRGWRTGRLARGGVRDQLPEAATSPR